MHYLIAILGVTMYTIFIIYRSDQHHVIETAVDDNISEVCSVFDSLNWSDQSYHMFESMGQTGNNVHTLFI